MNHHAVQRQGVNLIFPDRIPTKRSNRDCKAKIAFSIGLLAVGGVLTKNKWNYLVYLSTANYLFLFGIEIIRRLSTLCEEKHHINSRYDGKLSILLEEIISLNRYNIVILAVAFIVALFAPQKSLFSIEYFESGAWYFSFIAIDLLSGIIKMKENGIYTALLIEELKGLDYGSGMAHSFFYGYLQLILPQKSNHEKSVKKNIEIYESNHNVVFPTKKLYILIPLSSYCPNNLTDVSNKIENGHESEQLRIDIAGVRNRVYGNTVYKLLPGNNEVVYVMAEYATPLRTLSKVIAHNSEESRRYKRFQKEIVTNFYMTLEKIVREDDDCRDYCHLIYFRDIDENGERIDIDICDLILERINSNR